MKLRNFPCLSVLPLFYGLLIFLYSCNFPSLFLEPLYYNSMSKTNYKYFSSSSFTSLILFIILLPFSGHIYQSFLYCLYILFMVKKLFSTPVIDEHTQVFFQYLYILFYKLAFWSSCNLSWSMIWEWMEFYLILYVYPVISVALIKNTFFPLIQFADLIINFIRIKIYL